MKRRGIYNVKKEKKTWLPNECSGIRWIVTGVVGITLGFLLGVLWTECMKLIPVFAEGGSLEYLAGTLDTLVNFACLFLGIVLAMKWIAKTSVRDFILGHNGSIDKKQCITVVVLTGLGMLITQLFGIGSIHLRDVSPDKIIVNLIVCLLLVWMQTSFEEFVFRGFFIR